MSKRRTSISERQTSNKKVPAAATLQLSGGGGTGRNGLLELSPADLEPNPFQPRTDFPEDTLQELAGSIAKDGIIEPIVVRPHADGKYQIIAGERRWRAAKIAKLKQVPAVARECSDDEMELLALQENLHREDLNPMDRSRALTGIKEKLGLKWGEVAERVKLSRRRVLQLAGLQDLPEDVQNLVAEGTLTEKHARALGGLATAKEQREFAKATQDLSGDRAIKAAQLLGQDPERDLKAAVAAVAEPEQTERRSRASRAATHCAEALGGVEPGGLSPAERARLAGELAALLEVVRQLVERLGKEE